MKTAIEILRVTPTKILARAKASTLVTWTVVEDRDAVGRPHAYVMAGVICSPPNGSGRLHKVEARLYSPYGNNAPTWVSCDCENNLYTWEVAQSIKDSGSVIYSNGKMPNIRNPNLTCAACKHLARVLTRAVRDAKVRKVIFQLPIEEIKNPRYPGRAPMPKLTGRK